MIFSCIIPVSAVIATRNRCSFFSRTLESLARGYSQPAEIIIVDGSTDNQTKLICDNLPFGLLGKLIYLKADQIGAAAQRNQGVLLINYENVLFVDDDIIFEPDCITKLWMAISSNSELGGVNAMIVNQKYTSPGFFTYFMFRLMGLPGSDHSGKVVGPGVNLLPADENLMPEVVPVEWLNTTCTLYRVEAIPMPPFPPVFKGYSLMEDLALSLMVGKKRKLANVRTARIFHDSQPGDHKNSRIKLSEMEFFNRHFIMTKILGKKKMIDFYQLFIWEIFEILKAGKKGLFPLVLEAIGKIRGFLKVVFAL